MKKVITNKFDMEQKEVGNEYTIAFNLIMIVDHS